MVSMSLSNAATILVTMFVLSVLPGPRIALVVAQEAYSHTDGQEQVDHQERPLFGVQRWDMFSGLGATQKQELGYLPGAQAFLKPEEFHHRAPFFTRRTEDVTWVEHPKNSGPLWFNHPYDPDLLQQTMDQEIDFATDAGIDFFIFNGPARALVGPGGYGLNHNLDAYMKNTRRDKVKFVRALFGHRSMGYSRSSVHLMLDQIFTYMKSPFWQTVQDGRPLLPILRPLMFEAQLAAQKNSDERMTLAQFIQLIRSKAKAQGLGNPYIVGYEISRTHKHKEKFERDGLDAFSDYAGSYGGSDSARDDSPSYASATDEMIRVWQDNAVSDQQGIDYVPAMSIAQYPWPRAKSENWYHYQNPLLGEISERVKKTYEFIEQNKQKGCASIVISYSWNEHSEGGAINPTMGSSPDYRPNTRWLDEVSMGLPWQSPRKAELMNKNRENR